MNPMMRPTVPIDSDLSAKEARRIAELYGVKLPRMGYEVCLEPGLWLCSNYHADFGSFGLPAGTRPYRTRVTR